jgi:hypothetical protein
VLLDTGRVSVDVARLGEVARKTIFGDSSAIGEGDVVAVVGFV